MINLAGHPGADAIIENELTRCGIEVVRADASSGREVNTRITGKLTCGKTRDYKGADFIFTRAWRYWVVKGNVPLWLAEQFYENVIGKTDIRVAGHCACPPPEDWAEYKDAQGLKLVVDVDGKQQSDFHQLMKPDSHSDNFSQIMTEGFNKIHWCQSKEERKKLTHKAFIDTYHIDSELGLYIFVESLTSNGYWSPALFT